MSHDLALPLIFVFSVGSLFVAGYLISWVLRRDTGTPAMREISNAIKEGAEAFLRRQNTTILLLAAMLAALIFVLYAFVRSHHDFDPVPTALRLAFWTTLSFLLGAACSVVAGYIGMWISIRSNIRTASAARTSLNDALRIALRGGAVSGLFVVAMSLFGVGGLYFLVSRMTAVPPAQIPLLIVGYGFGASFVALFAQLGGGIYTKAADVGADLVGKVEAGIPEDDPRNPAVIADLVGDNVGDCAGRGADIFESTAAENVGAMILGAALYPVFGVKGILFPLIVLAINLIASIVGVFVVKTTEDEDPMHALNKGFYVTSGLALLGFAGSVYVMLNGPQVQWLWLLGCGVIGLITSFLFVWITEYYTESIYRPVQSIAKASLTGPATNIISGLAVGMETPALPVIAISAALLLSYYFGVQGLAGVTTISDYAKGIYGTAIATMGMLSCAAYILAMDTFGPITDNAGGIIEMSNQPDAIRERTDKLDSAGNTTKALTKGYAVGSASLAAFLLFSAYLDEVAALGSPLKSVDISKPEVFVGGLLGAMLVFWFSALAISAVTKAAVSVIQEVRRQFQADPGILKGTSRPDYGRAVDIVTVGALKAMVAPGLLAVGMPIAVGLVFKVLFHVGAETVASFLMVGTIGGILMATLLNNGGGAWDNAKKFIETGEYGGKGSPTHKAAVVGDTVGDPFKDTAGPSLHVLIKLLSTVTLVLAPLFV